LKLLIVEDNPAMRQTMRLMVADIADEISECSDGTYALAQYATEQPDWVLMDIHMPGLNGLSATQQIKAVYAAARIIIVTSFDDAGLREAAVKAGACGYVLKENLLELRHWLQRESETLN
jgi:CheY-like chemotaxis protein